MRWIHTPGTSVFAAISRNLIDQTLDFNIRCKEISTYMYIASCARCARNLGHRLLRLAEDQHRAGRLLVSAGAVDDPDFHLVVGADLGCLGGRANTVDGRCLYAAMCLWPEPRQRPNTPCFPFFPRKSPPDTAPKLLPPTLRRAEGQRAPAGGRAR